MVHGFGSNEQDLFSFSRALPNEFTIVSIPMFIVMGMAVASSPAGKDLYSALDRWLNIM